MAKRSKRARCSGAGEDRDRLSSLPDDILIDNILSRLPMIEAQRAGVLARRWRYLWRQVPCLDLDGIQKFRVESPGMALNEVEGYASDYAEWVDQTIDAYRGGTSALRCFRVLFRLRTSFTSKIDSWLAFSLRRGVEVLELNCCYCCPHYEFLTVEPSLYPNIRLLKSLTLKSLRMPDGCSLNGLLSACEFLETLHLDNLYGLTRVEVYGPVSRLKHIYIEYCYRVESIAIHAPTPDLVSFIYPISRIEIAMHIEHAPRLVHLRLCLPSNYSRTVRPLLRYLSQLEALHLEYDAKDMENIDRLHDFPVLSRLKHLKLHFPWSHGCKFLREKLRRLASLIERAPFLQHLTLDMGDLGRPPALRKELAKMRLQLLVPVIEISGFTEWKVHCKLALLLVKVASPALEKLIIGRSEPVSLRFMLNPYEYSENSITSWETFVRKEMRPRLPSKVKLVLISSYIMNMKSAEL